MKERRKLLFLIIKFQLFSKRAEIHRDLLQQLFLLVDFLFKKYQSKAENYNHGESLSVAFHSCLLLAFFLYWCYNQSIDYSVKERLSNHAFTYAELTFKLRSFTLHALGKAFFELIINSKFKKRITPEAEIVLGSIKM